MAQNAELSALESALNSSGPSGDKKSVNKARTMDVQNEQSNLSSPPFIGSNGSKERIETVHEEEVAAEAEKVETEEDNIRASDSEKKK